MHIKPEMREKREIKKEERDKKRRENRIKDPITNQENVATPKLMCRKR